MWRRYAIAWLIVASAFAAGATAAGGGSAGRISQLLEKGEWGVSCSGVVIELQHTTFKPAIGAEQLSIADDKYGRDLKAMMVWKVEPGGKRLTVRFKPGFGGFGTGNVVHIRVHTSAFTAPPATEGVVSWSIATDPL